MMKRFLCGALAAALVASTIVVAPASEAASVPKPTCSFDMNKSNKNVVRMSWKASVIDKNTYAPTEAAKKAAKGGIMPTKAKGKILYKKGHKGKGLQLNRTYGVELKNANFKKIFKGSWSISFWVKIDQGIGQYTPIVFFAQDLKDASAKWISITRGGDDWPNTGSPTIWSHVVKKYDSAKSKVISEEFPWYNKNGVDADGNALWEEGNAFDSKQWVHVVFTVNKKASVEYGEKGEDGYVKGYQGTTYVNGVQWGNGSIAKKSFSNKTRVFLGINGWDTPAWACYDDVQFYNKVLKPKQVKKLFKSQKNKSDKAGF